MKYFTLEIATEKIIVNPINEEEAFESKSFLRLENRKNVENIEDIDIIFEGMRGFIIIGNFTIDQITIYYSEKLVYALIKDGNSNFLNLRYCLLPFVSNDVKENIEALLNTINDKTSTKKEWTEVKDNFFKEQIPVDVFFGYGRAIVVPAKKDK